MHHNSYRGCLFLQLGFLRTYGGPPLAPADYLARNGLLPEDTDDIVGEQDAVQEAIGRSRADTALSLSSPPASPLRMRSATSHSFGGHGSVSDTSERSYATSLAQSEAGQSAKWKKTLVRTLLVLVGLLRHHTRTANRVALPLMCAQMRIFREFCNKYVDVARTELFEGQHPMVAVRESSALQPSLPPSPAPNRDGGTGVVGVVSGR
eukprot:COSAG02_NODE_1854_length_10652_cov_27.298209_5_plen_207_part_00